MKKTLHSILGVTLLEIMLVLAIASMVILMSIRYYQSASTNQKINATINTITGIVAAGESVLGATGAVPTSTTILPYLPGGALPNSPFGGPVTMTPATATSYNIVINTGAGCQQIKTLIQQNNKLTTASPCAAKAENALTILVNE